MATGTQEEPLRTIPRFEYLTSPKADLLVKIFHELIHVWEG